MAIKYTEEQLNSVDKSMLIQMFLNQQEQLEKVSADSFLIIKQIQAIYGFPHDSSLHRVPLIYKHTGSVREECN